MKTPVLAVPIAPVSIPEVRIPDQSPSSPSSPWKGFFERGGGWKALLVAVVYWGLYNLIGLLVGQVFGTSGGIRSEDGSPMDTLLSYALPIALGGVLLVIFAASLGWLRELFGPQPIRGRGWMWVAVAVVASINVSAFLSIDYGRAGAALVAAWLFSGLFIGFAEEVLTRGFAVNLMRKAGHGEVSVALVSSAIFAALHLGNLFTSNQGLVTTLIQFVYTFGFGICMYLALRVTGNLIWPILLHATTDPTLVLHGNDPADNFFGIWVGQSTLLIVLTGLILLIVLIVSEHRRAKKGTQTEAPPAA